VPGGASALRGPRLSACTTPSGTRNSAEINENLSEGRGAGRPVRHVRTRPLTQLGVGSLTLARGASVGIPALATLKRSRDFAEARGMSFDEESLQEAPVRRVATRYIVRIPVVMRTM